MKRISLYLLFFSIILSITTHAQQHERRIADARYASQSGLWVQQDSNTYIYSGNRNIDSAWGVELAFDTSYRWLYDIHSFDYVLRYRYIQQWNTSDVRQNELTQFWDTVAHSFFNAYCDIDSYLVNNIPLLTTSQHYDTAQHIWTNVVRTEKAYDNQDRLLQNVYLQWDSIGGNWHWDTTQIYTLGYNTSGQIITATSIVMPQLYASHRVSLTYDNLGRNDTTTTDRLQTATSTWRHYYRQIYSYNSAGDAFSGLLQNWDTIRGWIPGYQANYVYDSHHNNIQYINQSIDTAGQAHNVQKYLATYDSYDKITSYQYQDWDTSGVWVPGARLYHYYYEVYTATGVSDIMTSAQVRFYPVPASQLLSVDIEWQEPQPSTIALYDITGRICGEWHIPSAATYHGYMPVGMLPEGMYIAHITSPAGNIQRTINIVR